MSKIFIDTEFHEDGKTIDLISIAMVRDDGAEYYAISTEFKYRRASKNQWLKENVLKHLPPRWYHPYESPRRNEERHLWKPRKQIAAEIIAFAGKSPEFHADYCSYDWVALCQIYGRMIDLPPTWPMFCYDVQQLKRHVGYEGKLPQAEIEHDALSDARNVRDRWQLLMGYQACMSGEVDIENPDDTTLPTLSDHINKIHSFIPKMKGFA